MTNEEIKNNICTYIKKKCLHRTIDIIDCEKNLFQDYGFDSITIIELILYLEEEYGVEFDIINLDLVELRTINNITRNVHKLLKGRN